MKELAVSKLRSRFKAKNITLWDNNRLDIFMQPSNAQSCNYMGEWEKSDKTQKKK